MKNHVILITCAIVGLLTAGFSQPPDLESLEPSMYDSGNSLRLVTGQPTSALVIFEGAYLPADRYVDLGREIIRASGGAVAVFLPHFTAHFANPLQAGPAVQEAIDFLSHEGIANPASHLFVAGHSQGGIAANRLPGKYHLAGLILLGSYLPHTVLIGTELKTYESPVLTLGGELDGLTGINYLAREYASMLDLASSDPEVVINKPVVVLRGVKHMHFADGSALEGDTLSTTIDVRAAHADIAKILVAFMAVHLDPGDLPEIDPAAAVGDLKSAVADTGTLLAPYAAAYAAQNSVCQNMQSRAFPLEDNGWARVKMDVSTHKYLIHEPAFILDKSSVKKDADGVTLHLAVYVDQAPNITDISKDNALSPRSLYCKMRTQDAFEAESGLKSFGSALNCAQLNQIVLQETMATLTDGRQRARLEQRYGAIDSWGGSASFAAKTHTVTYGPFIITSTKMATGEAFMGGAFSFKPAVGKPNTWMLQTPELETAKTLPIQAFAGAFYCKVIAPARVVEWATLFGIR